MAQTHNTAPQRSPHLPGAPLRAQLTSAARFWEPRRVFYNLVLAAVLGGWIVASWPHFRPAMTPLHLAQFAVLGLLANVLYCSAYLVDLAVQSVGLASTWTNQRWILWTLGLLLAVLMENYWIADEIYPFVS